MIIDDDEDEARMRRAHRSWVQPLGGDRARDKGVGPGRPVGAVETFERWKSLPNVRCNALCRITGC